MTEAGSPASSVDSGELNSLLVELQILPAPAAAGQAPLQHAPAPQQRREQSSAKRRFVLDSESDADSSPRSSRPQASPRLEGSSWLAPPAAAAAAAAATQPPRQAGAAAPQPQQPQQQRVAAEQEVIEILDSSSSDSEAEVVSDDSDDEWSIPAPTTSQKQRRVVEDSDGSSDCEEVVEVPASTAGAKAAGRAALPPYFAAIPGMAAQPAIPVQQQPQPPRQQQHTQQTAAPPAPRPTAAAAAGVAQQQRPQQQRPLSASAFRKQREELAARLLQEFNCTVFEGQLPGDLEIKWNARLLTTAGLTHYRRDIPDDPYAPPIYSARVELSSKVLDSHAKLERTLCHELCHVAAWLLDHTAKPPHGPVFKRWADRAMQRYPHLDITTCHAYEIFFPFRWQCSNAGCLQSYGRHSNSIDVSKKVCGACRAPLVFLGRFRPDGTPAKQRAAPSKYAQFVKDNHAQVRAQLPAGTPQADVMRKLSERYAAQQQARAGSSGGSGADSASVSASVGEGDEDATSQLHGLLA